MLSPTPHPHTHLGVIENAAPVVGTDDGIFAVLTEVGGGDEARLAVHLVPQGHLLIRNVPQAQLAVQRAAQEVPVVLHRHTDTRYPAALSSHRYVRSGRGGSALTLGWKAIAVTKSMCWKQQRHSRRDMCQRRTVLSMDDDSRK